MAEIICPRCQRGFGLNNAESLVTRSGALTAGATTGALLGAEMGLVGGPVGGIAGTVPRAVFGGLAGWLLADQFRRCPHCATIFKT